MIKILFYNGQLRVFKKTSPAGKPLFPYPPDPFQGVEIAKVAIFLAVLFDSLRQHGTDSRQGRPISLAHAVGMQ